MKKLYNNYFGQSVCLIGKAEQGVELEPVYINDYNQAVDVFGVNGLAQKYQELLSSGASYIYLMRIKYDNEREKYIKLKSAYQVIEEIKEVDVILPADLKADDYIIDYPELFTRTQEFIYEYMSEFIVSKSIESINSIKVNDSLLEDEHYNITGDKTFEILTDLKKDNLITISYNSLQKIKFDYELSAFINNRKKETINLTAEIDTNQTVSDIGDYQVNEYFNYPDSTNVRYVVRSENDYIQLYTEGDGSNFVKCKFDYSLYKKQNTIKRYFIEQLAVSCSRADTIGVVKPGTDDYKKLYDLSFELKNILQSTTDYGKFIVCPVNQVSYNLPANQNISDSTRTLSGLISTYPSNISLTNKALNGISQLITTYTNDQIINLTNLGFTVMYKSIRNGLVPFKAVTLSQKDSPFYLIKNIRVVNEVSKRIRFYTEQFVGKSFLNVNNTLSENITSVLETIKEENKIKGYSFVVDSSNINEIVVKLEIDIINELSSVNLNIVSST